MKDNTSSQADESASAPLRNPTEPPGRILVVEDDICIRQLIAEVLIHSGYEVDAAEDGAAAWETLQTRAFNLLITDNNMPRLTGVELVRKLRSARMALPVIMATGGLPAEALAQNPSLQLAALLPKPFSIDELLATVRVVLRDNDRVPGNSICCQTGEASHRRMAYGCDNSSPRSGVRLTFPQPEHWHRG
jgi:DNA-binding response OmpR family regulator